MKKFLAEYIKKDGNRNVVLLIIYLVVQTAVFSMLLPNFMTVSNFQNLMRQSAELGMVSIPLAIVLMTGNIDLSIGSVMGVCAISMARRLKAGLPIPAAVVLTIGIGALAGSLNGLCAAKLHLDGLVATIGTQVMLRGFCYILTGGRSVSGLPSEFTRVSKMYILGVPASFLLMLVIFAIAIFVIRNPGTCDRLQCEGKQIFRYRG